MYLSAFQKEIIKRISQEKIKTIKDFLLDFNLVLMREVGSDFFFHNDYFQVINREEAYSKLIDFRKVINLLAKAELIEIEKSANLGFGYSLTEDRPKEIIDLIHSSRESFIITYNEINKFEKDFLTPQERNERRQLWVPIVVAIATVILSAILNYFIYTKEREVFIKNTNAFKDSLYVKILNNLDTALIQKKLEPKPFKIKDKNIIEAESIKKVIEKK